MSNFGKTFEKSFYSSKNAESFSSKVDGSRSYSSNTGKTTVTFSSCNAPKGGTYKEYKGPKV